MSEPVALSAPSQISGPPPPEDALLRLGRGLFYLGMFFLPLITIRLTNSLAVSDGMFILAAGAALLCLHPPRRAPRATAWYFGAFLFTLGGVLASFNADSHSGSLRVVLEGVVVLIIWPWASRHLLDGGRRAQRAISAYCWGSSLSAFVAILQELGHSSLGLPSGGLGSGRAVGFAQQTNVSAITFVLGILLVVGATFKGGPGRYWYRLWLIVILGLALMFTASVSGMAAVLAGLIVLLLRRGFGIRRLLLTLLVLGGLYFGGTHLERHGKESLNPFARISETTATNGPYNTINVRDGTYRAAWAGIENRPIVGHGLDQQSSLVYTNPATWLTYPTHNFVLLLWYEGGIFFVFGAVTMMGSAVSRMWRRRHDALRDSLLSAAVAVLVFSMAGPELFDRWLWLPFILAMTVCRQPDTPAVFPESPVAANGNRYRTVADFGPADAARILPPDAS